MRKNNSVKGYLLGARRPAWTTVQNDCWPLTFCFPGCKYWILWRQVLRNSHYNGFAAAMAPRFRRNTQYFLCICVSGNLLFLDLCFWERTLSVNRTALMRCHWRWHEYGVRVRSSSFVAFLTLWIQCFAGNQSEQFPGGHRAFVEKVPKEEQHHSGLASLWKVNLNRGRGIHFWKILFLRINLR